MKKLLFILTATLVSNFITAQINNQEQRIAPPMLELCPIGQTLWCPDNDGDGFGRKLNPIGSLICSATQPVGYAANNSDCNDNDASITDQGFIQYSDIDNDGLGDPNNSISACFLINGYVTNADDQCPTLYGTNFGCPIVPLSTNENYIQTTNYQVPVETQTRPTLCFQTRDIVALCASCDARAIFRAQLASSSSPKS